MQEIDLKTLDRYSYSKISTYKQCRFKFKLKYLDKNYLFSANIATEFGSLIHETEENIAKAIQAGQPIDYVALKNHFIIETRKIAHKYPTEYYTADKSNRTYQEKAYLYLDSAIYRLETFMKENPYLQLVGIEQAFEYNYDNVHSFSGSIDRAFLNTKTGEILIQDIKSWPVPAQANELKAPLQFAIYTMAAAQLWQASYDKIRCEYDLPLCNAIQAATSENLVSDGKATLDKLFAGIHANNFKPTITALCHWCEYNPLTNPDILTSKPEAVCPYFSTWQKSGDVVKNTLIEWQDLAAVPVDRQLVISQLLQQKSNQEVLNDTAI